MTFELGFALYETFGQTVDKQHVRKREVPGNERGSCRARCGTADATKRGSWYARFLSRSMLMFFSRDNLLNETSTHEWQGSWCIRGSSCAAWRWTEGGAGARLAGGIIGSAPLSLIERGPELAKASTGAHP